MGMQTRKLIRLQGYDYAQNGVYFITVCSHHRVHWLGEIMKWFKTQTTNEYIRGVKRGWYPAFDQHIWQRSYYDHIVRSRAEYRQIWQYIEENPLKWELDCYYHPEEMTSVPHRRNSSV